MTALKKYQETISTNPNDSDKNIAWELYLKEIYSEDPSKENFLTIINNYKNIIYTGFTALRNDFYQDKITKEEYDLGTLALAKEFEDKLIDLNVFENSPDEALKSELATASILEVEKVITEEIDKTKLDENKEVCNASLGLVKQYFLDLRAISKTGE